MSKIRINELARELEVKPNVIIDLLPGLGVGDKKTHSSSLDDDVALAIRQHLASEEGAPRERAPETEAAAHEPPAPRVEESARGAPTSRASAMRGAAAARPPVQAHASPSPGAALKIPTPRVMPARPLAPSAPAQPAAREPMGGGGPLRPPAKPNLAGQPAARPIVPPRPDLVAKLAQRPAMPGAPRPGMPTRPASPIPGQPVYRGPVRPGQPSMRGPGGPGGPGGPMGPGGPPMRGRGRPMHPTSPLRAEPATLPTDPGRRHATKPGSSRSGPDRPRQDTEGRMSRPVMRRDQPVEPPPIDREITIAEGVTVKELSEKLGVKANLVIKKLVEKKIFATINQTLDVKLAEEFSRG